MGQDRRDFLRSSGIVALGGAAVGLRLGNDTLAGDVGARAPGAVFEAAPPSAAVPDASLPGRRREINGLGYHVSDQGGGEKAVLLLHGMPDTSRVWRYQVPALLGAGYRVIVPDMPGYGLSDKPAEPARYAIDAIAADIVALLDRLGVAQADIIGHDWGAVLSWQLTLAAPQRFRRHVAVSVGHPGVSFGELTLNGLRENWYMYLNCLPHAAELYSAKNFEFLRRFQLATHPDPDEVCARLADRASLDGMLNWDRGNPLTEVYLAIMDGSVQVPRGQVPTLGIWSAGDVFLWEEQMQGSAAWMDAEWRYERLEKGSHWCLLDNHEAVTRPILDWLQQT